MKKAGVIVGILLIGAAYIAGFWPQHQKAQQARRELATVAAELSQTQAQLRIYGLQHRLLGLIAKTAAKNYGAASALSTRFFDRARNEEELQSDPQVKAALESILNQRDTVTADLAKGDPSALSVLNSIENTMFGLIDQTMKATDPASPSNTASPAG